ncbi:tyrosine--tRNA ligase [Fructilactobacillus lindneri]|uniref:Tyrosine--tRNA ligase n=2 Tax=Fructilactobacillus lindneri TaxID=53444 RepID=A0A0R2JSI5_9LACO|nr:tyrosine--tRNA ligase [Fructilactobacillus lindneri]ANZ57446.1 tyrosine--tRNA ligase [Fructilactobacillus lindneri]ANZ58714.1 tyrosine--tRNA ligase [Fructilactobacillus lindneri]KRN80057.1 Tyrosyl-tRNA synthetase [Fructilactobacillus lindneri DSM 20690 = JCM 11027]POG97932.1 tyrosine--tRNA ligase [Fructilactobacillus lindneri]POG99264.1 tyrosine--tRNA ligase [Fructilactobacillus lindneri]
MNIIDDLKWRGAINQQTDAEGLADVINDHKIALYCGIDPTGDSMHIGHLIPFMIMERFARAGNHPYILIGGATGSIGDPSGRKTERQLQTMDQVNHNVQSLTKQMKQLFGSNSNINIVNNYDWTKDLSLLDFLRDYGKLFNVNTMLNKEVVASRLDQGISFTEFTYQILQSIDFLYLHDHYDAQLQIGGADQWGNITAGIDLIHKIDGPDTKVFGLTIPLMVKADGTKFGKTAGGAIWLNSEKTSPYEFYQFWYNQDDRDVIKYLKYFTFLDKNQINELAEKVKTEPWKREAQKVLAEQVTEFVHGKAAVENAERISKILFQGDVQKLTTEEVAQAFNNVPTSEISNQPVNIIDLIIEMGIDKSKRQAREDVQNGAITVNGNKIEDVKAEINPADYFDGHYVIVRRGKKKHFLAKIK